MTPETHFLGSINRPQGALSFLRCPILNHKGCLGYFRLGRGRLADEQARDLNSSNAAVSGYFCNWRTLPHHAAWWI